MPSLKLSNPFRRHTARPTLRERAAALKATAGRVLRPKASPMSSGEPEADEADRTALLARLLAFYAEERASRPIEEDEHNPVPFRAAELVQRRTWELAREVLALPSPQTRDGLALAALAAAILVEGDCPDPRDPTDAALAGLTRAVLAFTGLGEPPGYTGFGYEADHFARGRAVCSGAGSVPAWAVAEIEAEGEREDAPENDAALPALSFPDARLIALGLELDASEQRERAEETEADAATDADARGAAEARINAACAETAAILERLATMPAHTAEGLRIKLRAIRHGIVAVDGSTTSCRVFRSLLRDAGVSETDLAAAAEG